MEQIFPLVFRIIPGRVGFLIHQVPFVYYHYKPLSLFYGQAENIQVLCSNSFFSIQKQQANIRFIHGLNGPDYRIKFQVLMHFCLSPDTCCIDQDKFFLKQFVMRMYAVPCGTGDLTYNGSLTAHQGVEQRGFAYIGLADNGKFGQA